MLHIVSHAIYSVYCILHSSFHSQNTAGAGKVKLMRHLVRENKYKSLKDKKKSVNLGDVFKESGIKGSDAKVRG